MLLRIVGDARTAAVAVAIRTATAWTRHSSEGSDAETVRAVVGGYSCGSTSQDGVANVTGLGMRGRHTRLLAIDNDVQERIH